MSNDIWVIAEHLRGEVLDITYTMLAAGRELADGLGGQLTAILLGHNAKDLASTFGAADVVRVVDHAELAEFNPDAYLQTLVPLIQGASPRVVIFGHTTIGMDIACGAAYKLSAPIVSSCRTVSVESGQARYEALTCGGKLFGEGLIPEPTCLITLIAGGYKPEQGFVEQTPTIEDVAPPTALDVLRTKLVEYIEPEEGDVDITKEAILISVGRGIQQEENLQAAEELATVLGGAVSASRPVVDWGWLPTSRLVGKSGKSVKPKLYLALGISGAPEHVEGVLEVELMIAVNTDEQAPIFDIATYGAAVDATDLMPVLTGKIGQAK